jgi:hypothetical protein
MKSKKIYEFFKNKITKPKRIQNPFFKNKNQGIMRWGKNQLKKLMSTLISL